MPIPLHRRTAAGLAAGMIALALAACDPHVTPPPPPPSSVTSPSTSPSTRTSPTPTVSIEDQDYAAAAEAFKNANRIIDEALMAGDGDIDEQALAKFAMPDGRYWRTETDGVKRAAKAQMRVEGRTHVVAVLPIGQYTPNLLRMYACYDGRDVTVIEKDGTTRKGTLVAARLTFRKVDGRWRVLGYVKSADGTDMNFQRVDHCDKDVL